MSEKPLLAGEAVSVACQMSVGANDPVAGNNQSDRVAPYGTTHSLCRAAVESLGNGSVCHGLSVRNGEQLAPDGQLKGRARKGKLGDEVRLVVVEIKVEPATGVSKQWVALSGESSEEFLKTQSC